jgi:MraZ protein
MVFYSGEYTVSFTGSGRIVLPKKVRELLRGNTFVLSKGYDTCLAGYTTEDWEKQVQELLSASLGDKESLEKKRFFFGSMVYLEIDEHGRFVIPKNLLEYAGLVNKEVVIVGVGDHFEVWDPEKWRNYAERINS